MILIFSTQHDASTDMVIQWLNYYGQKCIRINGDDDRFTLNRINSSGIFFRDRDTSEIINIMSANACWWRRSGIRYLQLSPHTKTLTDGFGLEKEHAHIEGLLNKYQKEEQDSLRVYVLNLLYRKIPINLGSPVFDLNRLCVLEKAKELGLQVPKYEIITTSAELTRAKNEYRNIVTKAIGESIYDILGNKRYYTYTEEVSGPHFENLCSDFYPSLIMEEIKKDYEVRSFYLDGKIFSMAIFSQVSEESRVDYRKLPPPVEIPYQLPKSVEKKLINLYKHLNLNTGSSDIIVDKNGNHFFLEINPVGQFGMTSIPCNYNLEGKIAKYLIYGKI